MAKQDKAVEPETVEEQGKILKLPPQKPYAFLLVGNDEVVDLSVNTFPLLLLRGALVKTFELVQKALAPAPGEDTADAEKVPDEATPPAAE